jgi:hypothetical protein
VTTAIVTALTTVHYTVALVLIISSLALLARWDYKRVCRRTEVKRARREEQLADPWASLPPKWEPPVAESHLETPR